MIDDPSYRSFLVRLWRGPAAEGGAWLVEVEHIQSGAVVDTASLEEALNVIRRSTGGDEAGSADPASE